MWQGLYARAQAAALPRGKDPCLQHNLIGMAGGCLLRLQGLFAELPAVEDRSQITVGSGSGRERRLAGVAAALRAAVLRPPLYFLHQGMAPALNASPACVHLQSGWTGSSRHCCKPMT